MDVEKANALMTEAGYSESNKLPLTLIVSSSRTDWVSACEVLKEELEQSYFTVNIEEISDTARFDNHDFDLGMIGIGLTSQFRSYEALFNLDTGLEHVRHQRCGRAGSLRVHDRHRFHSGGDEGGHRVPGLHPGVLLYHVLCL